MSRETDARAMLLDGHCCPIPPVTARLPFPYHWIPGSLRMRLATWLAKPNVQAVRADGCTIALHDMKHDNRIAFLSRSQVVERLRPAAAAMRELGIRGFRSPSWYTSRALWSALERVGFTYDMSVLDSWPLFDRARNYGTGTVGFPATQPAPGRWPLVWTKF